MSILSFRKLKIIGLFLSLTSLIYLYQNFTTLDVHANLPSFTRKERIDRFFYFIDSRKIELSNMGHVDSEYTATTSGYDKAHYLSPKNVLSYFDFAEKRYESYLQRIKDQAAEEGLQTISENEFQFPEDTAKPIGFFSPEEQSEFVSFDEDCSLAIKKALSLGNLWLSPGRTYKIKKPIVLESERKIMSDGSGTIAIIAGEDTAWKVNDITPSTKFDKLNHESPLRIENVNNVELSDFRLKLAAEVTELQPWLAAGIDIKTSNQVQIKGLELFGFPRIDGIIRVNSSDNILIADNLLHGAYTKTSIRQTSGIRIDGERIQDRYSTGVSIVGNFIFGMLFDSKLYFDTTYRAENTALGYESDGITFTINRNGALIANNSIMDVGEGIDTFTSNAIIRNNYIERAFNYGLKVVHSGSSNLFSNNRFVATGLAGIFLLGTPYKPEVPATATTARQAAVAERPILDNTFIKNKIIYANAFNISSFTEKIPKHAISAILLEGIVKRNKFMFNEISSPMYVSNVHSQTDWRGVIICKWNPDPSLNEPIRSNIIWKNELKNIGIAIPVYETNPLMTDCATDNFEKPIYSTSEFNSWNLFNSTVSANPQPASNIFNFYETMTQKMTSISSGNSSVTLSRVDKNKIGKRVTLSVVVKKGTHSTIMLREQIQDVHALFSLTGSGSVISTRGTIEAAKIMSLDDSSYLVQISYQGGPVARTNYTLRMTNAQFDDNLDIGDFRIDY